MWKLRLGPHTQEALTLLCVERRDPAGDPSKRPPRTPHCLTQEVSRTHSWALSPLQSPMKLVVPTAHGLDLEVSAEVRQCDLVQLSL